MLLACRGHCLREEGNVLAGGFPRGVRRDDIEAVDVAARAFPASTGMVDGDAVAVGVLRVPSREGVGRLFRPVVDVGAGAGADECFLAWVFGDIYCGPTLLAELAGDKSFVFAETGDTELAIPFELVPFDRLGAPTLLQVVLMLLAILIERDRLFSPLFSRKLLLCAPFGQLVATFVKLIVDLAWVFSG